MYSHPQSLCQTSGLASDSTIAPDANSQSTDLSLEYGRPIPYLRFLISNHPSQVTSQVHHHRQIPLRDGNIVNPEGIAGAHAFFREPKIVKLAISGGADLNQLQALHLRNILGREGTEQNVDITDDVSRKGAGFFLGLNQSHVEAFNRSQVFQCRCLNRHINQDFFHWQAISRLRPCPERC